METFCNIYPYTPWLGLIGMIYVCVANWWILQNPKGSEKMVEVAQLVEKGTLTFLIKEYSYLTIFLLIMATVLFWKGGILFALSYLFGSFCILLCGYIGPIGPIKSNLRATEAALKWGAERSILIAFLGASTMGIFVASLSLLSIGLFYLWVSKQGIDITLLNVALLGASSSALLIRIGGGIFTKAADMGADLVGQLEMDIPEDDPRNPAIIADNVGDNVGDMVGTGVDIFESCFGSMVAVIILGAGLGDPNLIALPFLVTGLGLMASIVAILPLSFIPKKHLISYIKVTPGVALMILFIGSFIIVRCCGFIPFPYSMGPFYSLVIGALATLLIGLITEYFTSKDFYPVKSIAYASKFGFSTNILHGITVGIYSSIIPAIIISFSIYLSYHFCGMYGIGMVAIGALATTGIITTISTYTLINDNCKGTAEMSGLNSHVKKIISDIHSLGNATSSIGKSFVIGPAIFTGLSLFAVYSQMAEVAPIDLINSKVMIGLFLGGMIPFLCGATILHSVAKVAQQIIKEIRRQFKEMPGLLSGHIRPDTFKCISIGIDSAFIEMIAPILIVLLIPLIVISLFGKSALGGLIIGATLTGTMLSFCFTNFGNALKSAKEVIEDESLPGESKNSSTYRVTIHGDATGDAFKDGAGPIMHLLVKFLAVFSIVLALLFN